MIIINLFAGPGTGKSTTAAALFAELKFRGVNCEYIPEYAKDAAWEGNRAKLFAQQDYIFAKQHWRIAKVADEVDFLITDSPLLMGIVYSSFITDPKREKAIAALRNLVIETHYMYRSVNIFLNRSSAKAYNPKGRNQTEDEAIALDRKIFDTVDPIAPLTRIDFSRDAPGLIADRLPELYLP